VLTTTTTLASHNRVATILLKVRILHYNFDACRFEEKSYLRNISHWNSLGLTYLLLLGAPPQGYYPQVRDFRWSLEKEIVRLNYLSSNHSNHSSHTRLTLSRLSRGISRNLSPRLFMCAYTFPTQLSRNMYGLCIFSFAANNRRRSRHHRMRDVWLA